MSAADAHDVDDALGAGRFEAAERTARAHLAAVERREGAQQNEIADALDRAAEAIAANWAVAADSLSLAERAVELRRKVSGESGPELASSLYNLARIAQRRGALELARDSDERSLAILEEAQAPDEPAMIAGLAHLAGYLDWYFGETSRSKELLDRAMSMAARREFRDPESAAVFRALGDAEQRRGNLRLAMAHQRRCIEIQSRLLPPGHGAGGMCWNNLAIASWRAGDAAGARFAAARASAIWEAAHGPDHPAVATALANLAQPTLDLDGDADGAAALLRRATRIYESAYGPDHDLVAATLIVLGNVRVAVGEYGEAVDAFERAAGIRERAYGRDHASRMDPLHLLAVALEELGELAEAERLYREIRAWAGRSGSAAWSWAMRVRLAHVLELQGDAESACREYRASAAPAEGESREMQGLLVAALQGTARCLARERSGLDEVVATHERALGIGERVFGRSSAEVARSREALGLAHLEAGNPAVARRELEAALEVLDRRHGAEHPDAVRVRLSLASVLAASGDFRGATRLASRAERDGRAHLRLLAAGASENLVLRYSRARLSGLDPAVSWVDEGRLGADETRSVIDELIRSRAIVQDVMAARAGAIRSVARTERAVHLAATSRLAHAIVRGPGELTEADYDSLLRRLRGEQAKAERSLAAADTRFREFLEAEGVGYRAVLAGLRPGQVLVSVVRFRTGAGTRYGAFVVRPDRPPGFVALGAAVDIDARVAAWWTEGSRRPAAGRAAAETYRGAARALRRAIWDPIAEMIEPTSLVFWVPDGALHAVAMGALIAEDGRFLVEAGPAIAPLSAERDLLVRVDGTGKGDLLVVGGVNFDGGGTVPLESGSARRERPTDCPSPPEVPLRPLPGSAEEADRIASTWSGGRVDRLGGSDATESRFKHLAPGRRAIHLATHAFILGPTCEAAGEDTGRRGVGRLVVGDRHPLRSAALAFAGVNRPPNAAPTGDDGWLTMEEIAALDLSAAAWVVLSACDTARGEVHDLEGIVGLRRAFRTAGAGTLVASLWAVDDRATSEWMAALYRARARVRDMPGAVREASLAILRARRAAGLDDHPYWWGGFVGGP